MARAERVRPLILALLLFAGGAAFLRAEAAECPELEALPQPAKAVTLQDILRLPKRPDLSIENSWVTTVGTLIHVREIRYRPSRYRRPDRVYRLWLTAGRPQGLKGVKRRHNAVVATIPAAAVFAHQHGPRGLQALVGKRVRVAGRLLFVASPKGELWWTRGSPWEIALTALCPVPPPPSSSPPPPPPPRPPAMPPERR